MNLSDLLADANAHVRAKEAEALAILKEYGEPANRAVSAAKRAYGDVVPVTELGVFISPVAEEMYKQGKRDATRLLSDAYATIVFPQVPEAEAFIVLLSAIGERVLSKLTVIDQHEADLRTLHWEKLAWERDDARRLEDEARKLEEQRKAKPNVSQGIWRRLRACFPDAERSYGSSSPQTAQDASPVMDNVEKAQPRFESHGNGGEADSIKNAAVPAQAATTANILSRDDADHRAAADALPDSADTGPPTADNPPSPTGVAEPANDAKAEKSAARLSFVMPILDRRKWTRSKWSTEAGVGKNSVYEYLEGARNLSVDNREAMAQVLGLKPEDLPD